MTRLQELEKLQEGSGLNIASLNSLLDQKDNMIKELSIQLKASKGFLAKNDHVAMQQKEIDTLEDDKFNAQVSEMILPVVETSQIKVLTKALLDKQAMLEAVTAEKNTLAFKVEKWKVCILSYF